MKNELLFGAAYYPETLPYPRIREDLSRMKEAGMNVIRIAQSSWNILEPEKGVFDFTAIDALLEEAERLDLQVIVCIPTDPAPRWLCRLDPDIRLRGESDRKSRGSVNFLNNTFRRLSGMMMRRLLSETAKNPCVIGYQLQGVHGPEVWDVPAAQELFRRYLLQKFDASTEALNRTYHLAEENFLVSSWTDFPNLHDCPGGGLAAEYEKFLRYLAADYLSTEAKTVREYKREDQFITHDFAFAAGSCGVPSGINHYEASQAVSLVGTALSHPAGDRLTGAAIARAGDTMRSLHRENYLNLKVQAQGWPSETPYPGQLRLAAYSHLASGSLGILYESWTSRYSGSELGRRGVLGPDLAEGPAVREAAEIGEEWRRLGIDQLALKKENAIAVVIDNDSRTAWETFAENHDFGYNDVFTWMYDSLYEMNLECDVVDVDALEPERYRMILTPALVCASGETLGKLENFVAGGGILVSSFGSFVTDENLCAYPEDLPRLLHEVFGIRTRQITAPEGLTLMGYPVEQAAELLEPERGEGLVRYEHRYWGSYAAITVQKYKQGAAFYIGCCADKAILKEIYASAADQAGLWTEASRAARWPVILRSGVNAKGKKIHYLLHYSAEEESFPCPYRWTQDLLTGHIYTRGEEIPLADWDVKILREEG